MNAIAERPATNVSTPTTLARASRRSLRIFLLEVRNELLKLARMPAFALPAIGFPWMFFVLFGLLLPTPRAGSNGMAGYLVATYGVFGVLGIALFTLGAGYATERGQGWTTARRALPSSHGLHLAARLVVAALLGLIVAVGLAILAATFGGVRMPTASWALVLLVVATSTLPFGAIGLLLGQVLGPNSAPGVINAIYLPMSFLSGLWIPIVILPEFLQAIAPVWPSYHAAQLALRAAGAPVQSDAMTSILALAAITVVAFALANVAARRVAAQTWG